MAPFTSTPMPIQVSASISETTRLSLAGSVSLFCAPRKMVPIRPARASASSAWRYWISSASPASGASLSQRRGGRDGAGLAQQLGALLVHLQEQQEGDLLDVIAVADALVTQHVGVVPDFADEGGGRCSWVLFAGWLVR